MNDTSELESGEISPKPIYFVNKGGRPKKVKEVSADELVKQIETGSFQVDQKWLLIELIKLYKDDGTKDRLKCLDMIAKISGYNESNSDEKAVINSLIESMRNDAK